jgi:hypothetical protein
MEHKKAGTIIVPALVFPDVFPFSGRIPLYG